MSPSSAAGHGPRTANLTTHNAIPLQEATPLWLLAFPGEGCLWLTHPGPLTTGTELFWAGLALSGGFACEGEGLGTPKSPPHSIVGGPASLPLVEVGLEGGIGLCSFYRQQNRGQRDVLIQPRCPCLARAGSPLAPPSKLSGRAAQW